MEADALFSLVAAGLESPFESFFGSVFDSAEAGCSVLAPSPATAFLLPYSVTYQPAPLNCTEDEEIWRFALRPHFEHFLVSGAE